MASQGGARGLAGGAGELGWGSPDESLSGSRLVCLGLNWALCVLINLEARVTSLAVWAQRNAKSKRQLRVKRKPIHSIFCRVELAFSR